jgi:hypothetical protein
MLVKDSTTCHQIPPIHCAYSPQLWISCYCCWLWLNQRTSTRCSVAQSWERRKKSIVVIWSNQIANLNYLKLVVDLLEHILDLFHQMSLNNVDFLGYLWIIIVVVHWNPIDLLVGYKKVDFDHGQSTKPTRMWEWDKEWLVYLHLRCIRTTQSNNQQRSWRWRKKASKQTHI